MKVKKIITMGLTAIMAVSAMSISAFAAEGTSANSNIDYTVYDEDLVYVQEDADMVAEYNANLANGISAYASITYTKWDWDKYSVYSKTVGSQSNITIPYYFVPTTSALWFNVEVTDSTKTPRLTVNILNDSGSFDYVGSYSITKTGDYTYEWTNKKRSLSKGQKYVFLVVADSDWGSALIDISNSSL